MRGLPGKLTSPCRRSAPKILKDFSLLETCNLKIHQVLPKFKEVIPCYFPPTINSKVTISLLIMRSAIELALPVALLNLPVERSLPRSSVL